MEKLEKLARKYAIKTRSKYLEEDNPYSFHFLRNLNSKQEINGQYYPCNNAIQSNYFLLINVNTIGLGGFTAVHLYEYDGRSTKLIESVGLYSNYKNNNIEPSVNAFREDGDYNKNTLFELVKDLNRLDIEISNRNEKYIKPVMDYHEGLKTSFGRLPKKLIDFSLSCSNSNNWIIVQLGNNKFKQLEILLSKQKQIHNIPSNILPNWNTKTFYTSLDRNDHLIFLTIQKKALDFISEVYKILGWSIPMMSYPSIAYAAIAPITNVSLHYRITKSFESNTININYEPTDIKINENIFEIIQQVNKNLKKGVQVTTEENVKIYSYSNIVLRIPIEKELYKKEYKLQEYKGEVDINLLPHGKGILKLKDSNRLFMGDFYHGLPHGCINEYTVGKHVSTKYYQYGVEHGQYCYLDPYTHVILEEGWFANGGKYALKVYHYEVNPNEHDIKKNANRADTLKFIEQYNYDSKKYPPQLTSKRISHAQRVWYYLDGAKLAVDNEKAVFEYKNKDRIAGNFKYYQYSQNSAQHNNSRGRGTFYGTCTYSSYEQGYILEGKFDEQKWNIKEGDVKVTIYDDVLNKYVKKSASFKNGKIKYNRTNLFDVLLDIVFDAMKSKKVNFEKLFYHSLNVTGKWLETALGTSVPPISASESYSWEGNYDSTDEIKLQMLRDKGYRPLSDEEISALSFRAYTFKYNGEEITIHLRNPTNGEVRMENSGEGHPAASRGTRRHSAIDILSQVGQDVRSPTDGIITTYGHHKVIKDENGNIIEVSPLRTIWIETTADTGENVLVKLMYSSLNESIQKKLTKDGQVAVSQGQVIGEQQDLYLWDEYRESARTTGNKISPHIHMEVHIKDDHMRWSRETKVPDPPFPLPDVPPHVEI